MTPGEDVPPGIAAIMAAIRQEVAAPPASPTKGPVAPAPATERPASPSESLGPTHIPPSPLPAGAPPSPLPAGAPPLALDAEARALLAPMLRDWLDRNLPEIVERAVQAELRRLTGAA